MWLNPSIKLRVSLPVNHLHLANLFCENHMCCLYARNFQASCHSTTSTRRRMWDEVTRGWLVPPSSSAYTWTSNDSPPSLDDFLGGWHNHSHVLPAVATHLHVKTPRKLRVLPTELADRQERLEVPWSSSLRPRIASKGLRPVHFFGEPTTTGRYSPY